MPSVGRLLGSRYPIRSPGHENNVVFYNDVVVGTVGNKVWCGD